MSKKKEGKKKQYYVSQYNFKDVKENYRLLYFEVEDGESYPNSENLFYQMIYDLQNRKHDPTIKNRLDEIFILNAPNVKGKEQSIYEKLVREGVYINGVRFLYSEKSSSMTRTQKTVYVREDLKELIEEYITLGKKPNKTVVAKWLSTRGLILSSASLMGYIPKIVVIPDFERAVTEDVKIIVPFEPNDKEAEVYKDFLTEKEAEEKRVQDYYSRSKELEDIFSQHSLKSKYKVTALSSQKSRGAWEREGRRVKAEELDRFTYVKYYSSKDLYYPVYDAEQTEEIKVFPLHKCSVGYDLVTKGSYSAKINCFDGMGLMSFEFAERVARVLGIKNTNAIQGRIPYIKGLFVKFNFKKYLQEELGTQQIQDLWGNFHNVNEIDILVTESCFKAKLDIDDQGKKQWLFKDMNEYYSLLEKYKFRYFGIANYAKDKLPPYAPTTYQLINALDLTEQDLINLGKETNEVIKGVLRYGDAANVKLFLQMIETKPIDDNNSEAEVEEDKLKIDYIRKAIEINERMIFEKEIQKFLYLKAKDLFQEMMIGRFRIPSQYMYITGDVLAFCEWAAFRDSEKTRGVLGRNQFYCKSVKEEQILVRYPLTHFSEVKTAPFIELDNDYLSHLHNIIQVNSYDLTLTQLSGADLDGDIVDVIPAELPISPGRVFKDAVINDLVQVNQNDKAEAQSVKFSIDSIWNFEKINLKNLTGKVTNINTTLEEKFISKGDLKAGDLGISVCKYLQSLIIDSAKTGQEVTIPDVLIKNAVKQPFYFRFIYGGKPKNYMKAGSPLSRLSEKLERYMKALFPDDKANKIGIQSYLDINHVHTLMIDESKYTSDVLFDLIHKLTPVYNEFCKRKGELDKENKSLSKAKFALEKKEQQKELGKKYGELYRETRERCEEICSNQSVLASAAVKIAYEYSKDSNKKSDIVRTRSYSFPWVVAPEGILENLKAHEDKEKTILRKVVLKSMPSKIIEIKNINEAIRDIKKVNNASVIYREGQFYEILKENREVEIKSKSPEIKSDKMELEVIEGYECNLLGLKRTVEEIIEELEASEVTLQLNGQYLGLSIDEENICGIDKKYYEDVTKCINLKDYIDQRFKCEVVQKYPSSLKVKISQI